MKLNKRENNYKNVQGNTHFVYFFIELASVTLAKC